MGRGCTPFTPGCTPLRDTPNMVVLFTHAVVSLCWAPCCCLGPAHLPHRAAVNIIPVSCVVQFDSGGSSLHEGRRTLLPVTGMRNNTFKTGPVLRKTNKKGLVLCWTSYGEGRTLEGALPEGGREQGDWTLVYVLATFCCQVQGIGRVRTHHMTRHVSTIGSLAHGCQCWCMIAG